MTQEWLLSEPPWLGWLAICLCRYLQRLAWLAQQKIHLGVPFEPLHTIKPKPWGQPLPGLPGWRFAVWPARVGVRSKDREHLSLPLVDKQIPPGAVEQIRSESFGEWVEWGRSTPQLRLRHWIGGAQAVQAALEYVEEAKGWLKDGRLAGALLEMWHSRRLASLAEWDQLGETLEAAVGDGNDIGPRRREFLLALIEPRRNHKEVGQLLTSVLNTMAGDELVSFCQILLQPPLDRCSAEILDILDQRTEDQAFAVVHFSLGRLDAQIPGHAQVAVAALRYLLTRGLPAVEARAVIDSFALAPLDPWFLELAILALEISPLTGLTMVRRCLRTHQAEVRILALHVLERIKADWSEAEMDLATADLSTNRPTVWEALPASIPDFLSISLRLGRAADRLRTDDLALLLRALQGWQPAL